VSGAKKHRVWVVVAMVLVVAVASGASAACAAIYKNPWGDCIEGTERRRLVHLWTLSSQGPSCECLLRHRKIRTSGEGFVPEAYKGHTATPQCRAPARASGGLCAPETPTPPPLNSLNLFSALPLK
jgi:hypothetical protein